MSEAGEPTELPVTSALPALRAALARRGAAVLVAPPGSGKTTRVPLALLGAPWLEGRRIVMLEPRRLAARAAAAWMAGLLGESAGETVGYRVRADTRVGRRTRIEVVTEGVLTRILQTDPALDGIGLVVFDEFHERSVHADVGLALVLEARAVLRPDLRVLVMSATLDGAAVAHLLGNAPNITASGRSFPVATHFRARPVDGHIEPAVASTVRTVVRDHDGDVLVFLPGVAEIRRTARVLTDLADNVTVHELHGGLPLHEQDRAIRPSPVGRRKVVLATSIAETSLTIEGVRVVVDAGLARVPRFSPRTGLTRLATVRVSRASAEQRSGRAGRVAPGHCYRLWTEGEHAGLLEQPVPEILEADLTPLALELAVWGTSAGSLAWLDPPPAAALAQAHELLRELDALDDDGHATDHGRTLAAAGLHPRLAHVALRGAARGHGGLACDLAALLSERDPLRWSDGPPDPDIRLRMEALRALRSGRHVRPGFDEPVLHRIATEANRLRARFGGDESEHDSDAGQLVALAYPDRIAQLRPDARGRFVLRNGRGAVLDPAWPLAGEPFLAVADVDGGRDGRIALAAPLARESLTDAFADQIVMEEEIVFDDETAAVRAVRRERLGALVLHTGALPDPDPEQVAAALLDGVVRRGLDVLPWTRGARGLVQRVRFARLRDMDWPDVDRDVLTASLEDWLRPHIAGMRRLGDLARLDLVSILWGLIGWDRQRVLDAFAPTHIVVPTGSRLPIDYADPEAPALEVRLQELFGLADGPRIGDGVPLTLRLLSPAHRPVQVTSDLAGFWRGSYHEVRKEMRGRYPKHPWPEDPLSAEPTRRAKPRGT